MVPCSRAVLGVCRQMEIQSLIAQWSFLYPTYFGNPSQAPLGFGDIGHMRDLSHVRLGLDGMLRFFC